MARGSRVDYPGAVHHVYARGIEKRKIFRDNKDRRVFLERVGYNIGRWDVHCFSWALMENHFHFILQSNNGCLPSFMRCLLTAFSMYFNERHGRVGHLFQNRYMSRVISKDSYLREAIRYVHLNPIRAGLVQSLEELDVYPWTGHCQIMKNDDGGWMEIGMMRELFTATGKNQWRAYYRDFIKAGYGVCRTGTDGIGDISAIMMMDAEDSFDCASRSNVEPPAIFFQVLGRISVQKGIPADQIMGRGKKHHEVDARRAVIIACKACLNVSTSMVSRWLGISEACGGYLLRTRTPRE